MRLLLISSLVFTITNMLKKYLHRVSMYSVTCINEKPLVSSFLTSLGWLKFDTSRMCKPMPVNISTITKIIFKSIHHHVSSLQSIIKIPPFSILFLLRENIEAIFRSVAKSLPLFQVLYSKCHLSLYPHVISI